MPGLVTVIVQCVVIDSKQYSQKKYSFDKNRFMILSSIDKS